MALTTNLISYWKLDESSGNAADSVGSNTGTVTNITYGAGKINNGATLYTGSTFSKIALGNAPFDFTGDFSFSFWYYWPSTGFNDGGYLFGRTSDVSPFVPYLLYPSTGNSGYVFQMNNTSASPTNCVNSSGNSTNTWHHIVGTVSGTTMSLYVDGGSASTATFSGTRPSMSIQTVIGCRGTDNIAPASGKTDEVGIWSRAITALEVNQIFNGGAGLQYPFTSNNSGMLNFFY